jgi:hypothetical protein
MKERLCNLFDECGSPEAPLCPLQVRTTKNGIWYPDEPICQAEIFQDLPWIKKQRQIAELRLTQEDGFFTVRMLETIHTVTRNVKGADPDDIKGEMKWLQQLSDKRATASEKRQERNTPVKKKPGSMKIKKVKTATLFKL